MLDRKIKVIRAMALEKDEFYPRYIVVDTETGEVVDDAQGWGGVHVAAKGVCGTFLQKSRRESPLRELWECQ